MKSMLLLILLSISIPAFAPGERAIILSPGERICPFERLFEVVAYIESRNDPKAFNSLENAWGLLQIRSEKLSDYNRNNKTNYNLSDCFDIEVSRKIFYWHCRGYENTDLAIQRWNGKGRESVKYLRKVQELLLTCK